MSEPFFQAEDLAQEWASRICDRLSGMGVTETEVTETRTIIFTFTRIAAQELCDHREIELPQRTEPFVIDAQHAHQIIELFLRGINQITKKLRDTGLDWSVRRVHTERLAWKLFNLAKLLVGFLHCPNPQLASGLNSEKDLQLLMKQTADNLLLEELGGPAATPMPWLMNWKR